MINKLIKYLTYGNQFCGIEYTTGNGQDIFRATVLKQTKKELVEDVSVEENSIEAIANALSKNQHIFLIVNTEKVLVKAIESEQKDDLKLVYKTYPNLDVDRFYYEVLSQGNRHFIALCRKDYIDNLIIEFSEHKLNVIDFSFGHSLTAILTDYINENTVYSSNSKIEFTDKGITSIEKHEPISERYKINGLTILSAYLLSFIAAIESVLNSSISKTNSSVTKQNLVDDFKQTRFFNQFLKFGGIFILGLLLINFLFFNSYFNKVNKLGQISELNQSTKAKIIQLDAAVSKKKKMVDDILKSNASKSSFYSDRIITTLPNSILLSEFQYQPLLKRISKEKLIELNEGIIQVSGTSNNSEVFSNWISQLEKLEWIEKVEIIDYGTESNSISEFKIKIGLYND